MEEQKAKTRPNWIDWLIGALAVGLLLTAIEWVVWDVAFAAGRASVGISERLKDSEDNLMETRQKLSACEQQREELTWYAHQAERGLAIARSVCR